jgi:hypothetical protein
VRIEGVPRLVAWTAPPSQSSSDGASHGLSRTDQQIVAREVAARLRLVPDCDADHRTESIDQYTPSTPVDARPEAPRPPYAPEPRDDSESRRARRTPEQERAIRAYQPSTIPTSGRLIDILM